MLGHREARHHLETVCPLDEASTLLGHLCCDGCMLQQTAALMVILGFSY